MKQIAIFGSIIALLFACNSKQEVSFTDAQSTENRIAEDNKLGYDPEAIKGLPSQTYRNDGYRPSVESEWIKVVYSPDTASINLILYWSSNEETPIELKLIESKLEETKDKRWSGLLKSSDGFFEYKFSVVEDQFDLIFDDEGRMQAFGIEQNEK